VRRRSDGQTISPQDHLTINLRYHRHVSAVESTMMFEPIGRETLSGRIREQLQQRISTGELQPGARIPSERALSEQFRVARTSVREAIQGLVSLGIIERRGNRSFVAERLPDVTLAAANHDDAKGFVRQLFETRRTLELPIIRFAAERADDDVRAEVTAVAELFRPGLGLAKFRRLDRRFHATIARACGNPLLVEVYGKVLARLFESDEFDRLLTSTRNRSEVRRIVDASARHHAAIAAAIAAGDADAAVHEGARHLDAVERGIVDRLV
jgi:GntR family transcriptional regulator, transcriptional repressor for pyruvate dehydrogenase complex